ncbi:MAG: peptidylprolyl isomerase [Saprospiraceae bacterium]|nr:peptidylprolyl isomerase [Saprospiraceae bacterium]
MNSKLTLLIALLFLFGASAYSQQQRAILDKVIAVVGSEILLLSDLEEQYALIEAQSGVLPPDARCNILDNIMVSKLLLNQAKLDSIVVAEAEVEEQLNARIDRIMAYMNNDVANFENYYGQTVSEVKDQFREDLKNQILTERMQGQLQSGISITPAEVKAFFNKIPRDSLPYFNAEVEVGEIVYKPKVNPGERQTAIDKLTELRKRIVDGGEDFAELARKFSDDGGSARAGGDLGWTKRGIFVPAFEAAAYKLEKDEISPIVESEFGFHIIQLLDRRGNTIHTRHILIKPDITDEDLQAAQNYLDSVRQLILSDSVTFSLAVKRFSHKEVQSYNNDGRMVNPATGNTFFQVNELDPDIYFAIDTLKVGGITTPFEFTGPDGETYYRIVVLQSRVPPHRASLAQDYSKIQKAAVEAKKNEHIAKWIAEKMSSTYVHFDPAYKDCRELAKWKSSTSNP